jgi:hypothetical protein
VTLPPMCRSELTELTVTGPGSRIASEIERVPARQPCADAGLPALVEGRRKRADNFS